MNQPGSSGATELPSMPTTTDYADPEASECPGAHVTPSDEADNGAAGVFKRGDEVEIALRLLAELEGAGPRLVFDLGELWRYNPTGIWACVPDVQMIARVATFAGRPVLAAPTKDGESRTKPLKVDKRHSVGAIHYATAMRTSTGFFEGARKGLAFRNGFLKVTKDGATLQLHSPDNRCRASAPCDWDPDADAPRFLKYLAEVFQDDDDWEAKAVLLQEFTGACLLGMAPTLGKALVLVGPSANNGKSQFLRVVEALFPPDSTAAVTPQQMARDHSVARLAGKRLNVVNELPTTDVLATEAFKSLVTGEAIEGRPLYKNPFKFKPTAGHLFSCNDLPKPAHVADAGFFRRWLVVHFNHTFTAGKDEELSLCERIIECELAGVFAWAVNGAVKVVRRRAYTIPPSCHEALDAWRHDADQVRQWKVARTSSVQAVGGPGTTAQEAYADYRDWAADTGHGQLNLTEFGKRLSKLIPGGPHKRKDANYYPIRLMRDSEDTGHARRYRRSWAEGEA